MIPASSSSGLQEFLDVSLRFPYLPVRFLRFFLLLQVSQGHLAVEAHAFPRILGSLLAR